MSVIEVKTQAQLDKALKSKGVKDGHDWIACVGHGRFEAWESSHVEAWGSSHVVARGSSHVEARGSSHVEAWESSHVVAWGSSHVVARGSSHVEARGSSHVVARESSHVEAWESSHVVAWESSHVVASEYVAVHKMSGRCVAQGGVIIDVPVINTVDEWLEYYGLTPKRGIITLFKAVNDNFVSSHDFAYLPGTKPRCPDFEDHNRCGNGLHMCAHPEIARGYNPAATKYVACPVRVKDLVLVHPGDRSDKVKAKCVAAPIWECNRQGEAVA